MPCAHETGLVQVFGKLLQNKNRECQVSVLGECPGPGGSRDNFVTLPIRGSMSGNKTLTALPASKDAVSPSIILYSVFNNEGDLKIKTI